MIGETLCIVRNKMNIFYLSLILYSKLLNVENSKCRCNSIILIWRHGVLLFNKVTTSSKYVDHFDSVISWENLLTRKINTQTQLGMSTSEMKSFKSQWPNARVKY